MFLAVSKGFLAWRLARGRIYRLSHRLALSSSVQLVCDARGSDDGEKKVEKLSSVTVTHYYSILQCCSILLTVG